MKFNADLNYQNIYTVIKECEIERTVQLSAEEFDEFSADLMKERGFIRDNKDCMFFDSNGTYHCLLVTGKNHADGLLVYSDGRDYANYACHVPDAAALLTASRYPSLSYLTGKLTAMADHLVGAAMNLKPGETSVTVGMDELEELTGIDVARNTILGYTLRGMLSDRPEIADWELDGGRFILMPAPVMAEPEMGDGPEMRLEM